MSVQRHILYRFYLILCAFLLMSSGCRENVAPTAPGPQHTVETTDTLPSGPFLVVLGVAQDAGYPQVSCGKNCCQPALKNPSLRQKVACLGLVDPASKQTFLFDATPDFTNQVDQLNQLLPTPSQTPSGIFLTHAHMGHYSGLMYLGREAMGSQKVPVYAMPRMKHFLETNGPWNQLVSLENIVLEEMKEDEEIKLKDKLAVVPLLVPHRDEFSETVGFRIQGPRKNVLFIPDINKWELWEKSLTDELAEVDCAFLDATFFQNGELPGRDMAEIPHPFVEETMQLLEGLPDTERAKVHFIHFNHTNPLLQQAGAARAMAQEKGFNIAFEGQIVPL